MIAPVLLVLPALAQAAPPRVAMFGNSYTQFNDLHLRVSELLASTVPALAEAEGHRFTAGGLRLPNHVERVERGDERWVDALMGESGRWRWVVLQDQSQVPGFPESEAVWRESADSVPILDGYVLEQAAETVLFMTWGRRDGDSTNPDRFPDFETMNAFLDAGYRSYAERPAVDGRTLWIAPVGRAFAAVYERVEARGEVPEEADSDFHRLYDRDGSHPSPLGSSLAAGVFVRTLTGWTPHWSALPPGVEADELAWLPDLAEAAVVPFEDLPYPWAHELADWLPPDDLERMEGVQVVSELELCPTLRVADVETETAEWHLGGDHGGGPGCGRLWLSEGAELVTDAIGLAQMAGARGEVVVQGGRLLAGAAVFGSSMGEGRLHVAGGTAELGAVSGPQGRIRLSGGLLRIPGGELGGALLVTDGELILDVEEGGLSLTEPSALAGALVVEGLSAAAVDVVRAPSLQLADDLAVTLPDRWTWELVDTETGQIFRVLPLESDEGGGELDEEGGDPSGADDSATASGEEPADASPAEKGCGCTSLTAASRGAGAGGLLLACVAAVRRRR